MNALRSIMLCLLTVTHAFGAQVVKQQAKELTFTSTDQKTFRPSKVWIQESRWILRAICDPKREAQTIAVPLPLRTLNRIDSLLKLFAVGDYEGLRTKLIKFVGLDSNKELSADSMGLKLQRLDELYQKILTVELDCLTPFIEETLCSLMRHKTFIQRFFEDPTFLYNTQLSADLAEVPVAFIPRKDLHFLQARLCTECKIDFIPTCLDVDATGEYLVICGKQKSSKYFLEVVSVRDGTSKWRLPLDYAPRGVQFLKGRKILLWGDHTLDLFSIFPLTKCTPQEWEKRAKAGKKIWAVGVSPQETIAVGMDEKIFLTSPTDSSLQIFTDIVSKNDKARSKKGRTALMFVDHGKILVELYKDGELYFYRCDNKVRIGQDSGLTNIEQYYPNESQLITISSRREARIWNCRTGQVEKKGTMPDNKRMFVSYGLLHEVGNEGTTVFCDTMRTDFPDTFVQGGDLGNTVEIGPDRIPRIVPTPGTVITTNPRYKPNAFAISHQGSTCIGIDKEGHVTIWHYYDRALSELLTSNLTLTQGFCVFEILEHIRSQEPVLTFLRKPHMKALFESLPLDLQTHLSRSFSSVRRAFEAPGREGALSPDFNSSSTSSTSLKLSVDQLARAVSTPTGQLSLSARLPIIQQIPTDGLLRAQSDSDKHAKGGQDDSVIPTPILLEGSSSETPSTGHELGSFKTGLAHYRTGAYKEAYGRFTEAAHEQESPFSSAATFLLGEMLLRGNGVPYNPAEAVSYYERVIKSSDDALKAFALLRLGEIYYHGLGTITRSLQRSIDYFMRILAIEKPVIGCKVAAHFYLLRIDRRELQKESSSHYTPAVELAKNSETLDPLALLFLGRLHLECPSEESHEEAAAENFLEVAMGKDKYLRAEAWYRLGKYYFEHKLTSMAQKYFRRTLEQDCNNWIKPMAEVYLGRICMQSNGADEKVQAVEALDWFNHAKKQSQNLHAQAEACYWIARLHEGDYEGIEKDASLVFENDSQAVKIAENNHDKQLKAHLALGQQFQTGTGTVTMNRKRAATHLKKVIDETHDIKLVQEACYKLAEMYNAYGTADEQMSATNLYTNLLRTGTKRDYMRRAQEVLAQKVLEVIKLTERSNDDDDCESNS